MAENTINSEIQRLKKNVADVYTAVEQNMGTPVEDEHVSEYMNENVSEIGRHVQAVLTDDIVKLDIDLDEYEIIDLTNLDGNLQDKVITQNGEYTYDAGYTGLGNVTVALNIDEKPDVVTRDGTYYSSDDDLGGYNKFVVAYEITNQDKTITKNGVYNKDAEYDGFGEVTVALPLDTKTIQHNGTYNASSDNLEGYTSVNVEIPLASKPTVITRNGTYNASVDSLDGYTSVQVQYDTHNQDKTITQNGTYTFDEGYDGLGTVEVALQVGPKPDTITSNGTYISAIDNLAGYSSIVVDVDVNNENRTFTENGTYYPNAGYNGMYEVVVDVQASTYLNNVKNALINLGLTPPLDDSDLADFITETYTEIHNRLSEIHGE